MQIRGLKGLALKAWKAIGERAGWAEAWNRGEYVPSTARFADPYGSSGAMQCAALSACVRLISGNVAKLPIHVFRLDGEDRERERDHPLDRVLNVAPNEWQTPFEFKRMLTAHVALHGNGYGLKDGTGRRVERITPFPDPLRMTPKQDDEMLPPVYEYRPKRGPTRTYLASDILHLRDLSLDGLVGLSRIEQARQGISLAMAAESYAHNYFTNGAEPGLALSTDKTLTTETRDRVRAGWKESHRGVANSHEVAVLEGGLKIERLGTTNKDSQFLELRSFQVEDIARLYGVPPHMIGLTEKQTSYGTGVEQQSLGFLKFHLLDWLVMWTQALRRDCVSEPDVYLEHVVEGLLAADIDTRARAYTQFIQNGIASRNECRKKENLPPYEGGDEFLYPSNMTLASQRPEATPERPTLPAEHPAVAWRVRMRAAQRALLQREVA